VFASATGRNLLTVEGEPCYGLLFEAECDPQASLTSREKKGLPDEDVAATEPSAQILLAESWLRGAEIPL
jgi:hypothetical protein